MIERILVHSNDTRNNQAGKDERLRFADIHCHCLPGLDDGPKTTGESIALCEMLAADGITAVVATPHQLGRFEGCNEAVDVRQAICDLNESLKNKGITLEILPGGEVRVDERIRQLLETDRILTLADGGKFILIELPYEVFINIEPLLEELTSIDIQPIISHVERISPSIATPQRVLGWLEHTTHLQITAASLLGNFGSEIQRRAWNLLASGRVAIVATDAHDTKLRRPLMKQAYEYIQNKLDDDIANMVCVGNPFKVINGEDLVYASNQNQQEATR